MVERSSTQPERATARFVDLPESSGDQTGSIAGAVLVDANQSNKRSLSRISIAQANDHRCKALADRLIVIPSDKAKPASWVHPLLTSPGVILCAIRER